MGLVPNPLGDIVGPIGRLEERIEALSDDLAALDDIRESVRGHSALTAELLEEVRGLRADLASRA